MRRIEVITLLRVMLAIWVALLVAGAIGYGGARSLGALPPLDIHLTLDGRHALVLHNDLPCVPDEPPTRACPAEQMRHTLQIIYSTPRDDWGLLTIPQLGQ